MDYYLDYDILSCPQHEEAKKLANKLWHRWYSLENKAAAEALNDNVNPAKLLALCDKVDKVYAEFCNVKRGINRCCGDGL